MQPVAPVAVASAPPPAADVAPPPAAAPPKPKPPEPPAPQLVTAGAMLVWIEDSSALGTYRTQLVEPAAGGAKLVAERPEIVVASSKELWVLRTKKTPAQNCVECTVCNRDPRKCKKNKTESVDEPFLQSLATGRVLEPWKKTFTFEAGCSASAAAQDASVTLVGTVGPVLFGNLSKSVTRCADDDPTLDDQPFAFDLEGETAIAPTLPDPPTDALTARAKVEILTTGCVTERTDTPALYWARAAYGEDGVLRGVYGFTMTAPPNCASGPGHQATFSEQKSPWAPPELAAYGKLPAFVVSYMADRSATFATPIAAARVADAEKEMARTDKELARLVKAAAAH
jgi:hypothetical protein